MEISAFFPMWKELSSDDRNRLLSEAVERNVPKGTILHNGAADCSGLLLIKSGQLRAFMLSDEGREITLYRLFELDICLFSASCMIESIQFDITIEAEKDSEIFIIPPDVYKDIMERSAPLANYTNQIMASRFSEVMWLIEQILWKSFDKRLAEFILDESNLEDSDTLKITHEAIGSHLGTAREVVTRMLNYFQSEGMVKLTRGTVKITDASGLKRLAEN